MRRQGGILAFVAALGAFTYASYTVSPANTARRNPVAISEPVPQSEGELAETFSKFDKFRTFTIDSRHDSGGAYLPVVSPHASFDWAIATVPDPERSLLSLDFDREIEAIQLAATDAHYQFERYWFPWRTENATSASAGGDGDASYVVTRGERQTVLKPQTDDRRKDLPGVLLFRSGKPDQKPLAIFLVGETPTGGTAVRQFGAALSLGSSLGHSGAGALPGTLPIIGPGFSGSLDSLAKLIHSDPRRFLVNTWTTSFRSHKQFSIRTNGRTHNFEVEDSAAINAFVHYVRTAWRDHEPIVILTEEQTAFGAGVTAGKLVQASSGCSGAGNAATEAGDTILDSCVFSVPFPRNLSRLRNASESQQHVPAFGGKSQLPEIPHIGLLLSLKEEQGGEEIPTYSRQQTPVSQESVLFTIGSLLKTGVVHYVGIFATDPLDTLFLARYLRSECPNVRLFVPSPDLLFEHGSDVSDYSGILSLSRYPLFPFSQLWSRGHNGMRIFPSAAFEAIYNATLASIGVFTGRASNGRDELNPFTSGRNPLWLTVAGGSGFEPIAVFNSAKPFAGATPATSGQPADANFVFEYWALWSYLFAAILLCCIGYCAAVSFAKPHGSRIFAVFSTDPQQFENSRHAPAHAFFLSCIGLCLTTTTAVWLAPPGLILQQNLALHDPHATIGFGVVLLLAGMLSVACLRVPRFFRRRNPRLQIATAGALLLLLVPIPIYPSFVNHHGSSLHHLWILYCAASAILGLTFGCSLLPLRGFTKAQWGYAAAELVFLAVPIAAVLFAFGGIWGDHPVDFLAAYRSVDLTNGVSPLIPISVLLIISGLTAFFHLRRIMYFEDRRPDIPDMNDDEFCSVLSSLEKKINHRISAFRPPAVCFLAALPIGAWLAVACLGSSQTLEKTLIDRFVVILVFASGIFIVLAWIRLLAVWFTFSEFLQQLERHPIREVFSSLPKSYMWSPVWQGGGQTRTHVLITRSIECLQALVANDRTPADLKDNLRAGLDSLRPQVHTLLEASAKGIRFHPAEYRKVEQSLRKLADLAARCLRTNQWNSGRHELQSELATGETTEVSSTTKEVLNICGELVVFRLLAYINFVLWHLENLVTYISAAFLLLVIALNSYAFRSLTVFDWVLVAIFVALTTGIVIVFSQAARDPLLSRITGTEKGKLDRNFLTHLISYGALPALALLATHFPIIGRFFFSWVKPALEAIH